MTDPDNGLTPLLNRIADQLNQITEMMGSLEARVKKLELDSIARKMAEDDIKKIRDIHAAQNREMFKARNKPGR